MAEAATIPTENAPKKAALSRLGTAVSRAVVASKAAKEVLIRKFGRTEGSGISIQRVETGADAVPWEVYPFKHGRYGGVSGGHDGTESAHGRCAWQ